MHSTINHELLRPTLPQLNSRPSVLGFAPLCTENFPLNCVLRIYSSSERRQALRGSASMAAQNMSTCLVIRAPNQKIGDQQVYCSLDWSVQQLKQHLSKVYPNNPKPEDQKLIYSGQLLEDEMTLKDVFQMDFGKIHILHLVCRPGGDNPEASPSSVPLVRIFV
ncbi:hypothetical protein V5799_013912 [Amblyomma americanum]|uniref:Ubiquitin-like domain-containing protein n=1 Tax=Amblyomma americanum TaxID=6943 RepID=A0AAQ4E4Q8_AMBAM